MSSTAAATRRHSTSPSVSPASLWSCSALVHDLNGAWAKFGQRGARNREDVGIDRHARKKHRGRGFGVDENQCGGGKV